MPIWTATIRARLWPCSPPGRPQPSIRSSMSRGSSWGTLARAVAMMWAVRSSGRTSLREPLKARPIGERVALTMTASGMTGSSLSDLRAVGCPGGGPTGTTGCAGDAREESYRLVDQASPAPACELADVFPRSGPAAGADRPAGPSAAQVPGRPTRSRWRSRAQRRPRPPRRRRPPRCRSGPPRRPRPPPPAAPSRPARLRPTARPRARGPAPRRARAARPSRPSRTPGPTGGSGRRRTSPAGPRTPARAVSPARPSGRRPPPRRWSAPPPARRLTRRATQRSGGRTGLMVPRSGQVPTTTSQPLARSAATASPRWRTASCAGLCRVTSLAPTMITAMSGRCGRASSNWPERSAERPPERATLTSRTGRSATDARPAGQQRARGVAGAQHPEAAWRWSRRGRRAPGAAGRCCRLSAKASP